MRTATATTYSAFTLPFCCLLLPPFPRSRCFTSAQALADVNVQVRTLREQAQKSDAALASANAALERLDGALKAQVVTEAAALPFSVPLASSHFRARGRIRRRQ